MPFVAARCPICGGKLNLDDSLKQGFCMHCGERIIVEEAIKNVKIEGKVSIDGITGEDQLLKNAITFLNLGETYNAQECFKQLTKNSPHRYEGWWGMFLTLTNDGTNFSIDGERSAINALNLAVGTTLKEMKRIYEEYINRFADALGEAINYKNIDSKDFTSRLNSALNIFPQNSKLCRINKLIMLLRKFRIYINTENINSAEFRNNHIEIVELSTNSKLINEINKLAASTLWVCKVCGKRKLYYEKPVRCVHCGEFGTFVIV